MNHHTFKRNAKIFWMLLVINGKYWIGNKMNLFLGIVISLFIMVCWLAFRSGDPFLLISGVSVSIIRNGFDIHQKTITDWKEKGLNNRLESVPINKHLRSAATITFNFITTFLISIFMFGIAILSFSAQRPLVMNANWLMVISGLFLTWVISILMATLLFLYVKNIAISLAIGSLVYVISLYFLGLSFPIETILSKQWEWLGQILYIMPQRYSMNIAQAGFANSHYVYQETFDASINAFVYVLTDDPIKTSGIMNIVNFPLFNNDGSPTLFLDSNNEWRQKTVTVDFGFAGKAWIAYLGAIGWIIIYTLLNLFKVMNDNKFHFENEYGKITFSQDSSNYVSSVKNASSKEELELLHQSRLQELSSKTKLMNKLVKRVQEENDTSKK